MNRRLRMRQFNSKTNVYDTLFPQTVTENVLRRDNGGVLESYLHMYDKHIDYPISHFNWAHSFGTHRHLKVFMPHKVLVDKFPIMLTLHTELGHEPTLDFNESGPKPIINGAGERIPGGQIPGAVIMMTYSEAKDAWIIMSNDNYSDITRLVTPIEHTYWYEVKEDGEKVIIVPGFNRHNMRMTWINYGQTVLVYGRDFDFNYSMENGITFKDFDVVKGDLFQFVWTSYVVVARRGSHKYDLVTKTQHVSIETDDTTTVMLPSFAENAMSIRVIYGQTLLREGLDYIRDSEKNEVTLSFPLMKGDLLSFAITKLTEVDGDLVPNNWGTKGTYRYQMHVLHGEYISEDDHVTVIPVPQYDHIRDEITIIRDNHMLVYDVDYTIDSLDQIILLTGELMAGDQLHWTIMKGALFDVPDFNVITASGNSGQHILVDIHDDAFCNFYVLLIKLIKDLETAPTIKGINGPARPVADCFGNPVMRGYKAGSFLWVVYNEDNHTWYSLGHSQLDVTSRYPITKMASGEENFLGNNRKEKWYGSEHLDEVVIEHRLGEKPTGITITPIEPPNIDPKTKRRTVIGDIWTYADNEHLYVGNTGDATSKFQWKVTNQEQTVDLTAYIEQEINRLKDFPGKIVSKLQAVTIEEDDTTFIEVDWFDPTVDKLLVNYGQTILREEVDWIRDVQGESHGIRLINMSLMRGDIIQFTIIKQERTES